MPTTRAPAPCSLLARCQVHPDVHSDAMKGSQRRCQIMSSLSPQIHNRLLFNFSKQTQQVDVLAIKDETATGRFIYQEIQTQHRSPTQAFVYQ